MTDDQWRPVVLRNGTLYGFSPRMRFDLVINIFSYCTALYHEVRVFGDGLQWRPFLHVSDCARAFLHFLEQPAPRHVVYNIANENLRVVDLVAMFQELDPRCRPVHVPVANPDLRNYRVDLGRMQQEGIVPRVRVRDGAEEMVEAIVTGRVADPEAVFYRNAKWLKELSELGQRDHGSLVGMLDMMAALRQR
jgi:nucleoside-diphosphate-sugar epimerase